MLWTTGPAGREMQGVTVALRNADGYVEEVRIVVRPFPLLAGWRERLRKDLPPAAGWELPPGTPRIAPPAPGEAADPRLPFRLTEDAQFHGPIFVRTIEGASTVSHVIGHARAVYGVCDYGPVLQSGAYTLRTLTSKLPLEMVSLSRVTPDGRVAEFSVFMQPWPVVELFHDAMRARLADRLDASFFEP